MQVWFLRNLEGQALLFTQALDYQLRNSQFWYGSLLDLGLHVHNRVRDPETL
jgi:hypothetical protein